MTDVPVAVLPTIKPMADETDKLDEDDDTDKADNPDSINLGPLSWLYLRALRAIRDLKTPEATLITTIEQQPDDTSRARLNSSMRVIKARTQDLPSNLCFKISAEEFLSQTTLIKSAFKGGCEILGLLQVELLGSIVGMSSLGADCSLLKTLLRRSDVKQLLVLATDRFTKPFHSKVNVVKWRGRWPKTVLNCDEGDVYILPTMCMVQKELYKICLQAMQISPCLDIDIFLSLPENRLTTELDENDDIDKADNTDRADDRIDKTDQTDEIMVPYKGKNAGNRKQYVKNKPKKCGHKIFVKADRSPVESSLGMGAKVVIALCKTIPDPAYPIVYFDNFFTSLELIYYLREEMGIFSLGTIRAN
ncbi:hypothetical protein HW555_011302, partial [Spodoptera exigua]